MTSEEIIERHLAGMALVESPLLARKDQPDVVLDAAPPGDDDTVH